MACVISNRFDDLGSDGSAARLGIMGGTFDPIHIGHLRIAEEMRCTLSLDAVLFVPTGNPVFKKDKQVTDAALRLEMCRRAVLGNPHFDVSSIEVDRPGDTYTVDTLRQLRSHYPDNVEFFFIVGADAAATVGKWRGVAELVKLAHLSIAAGRPGAADSDAIRAALADAGICEYSLVEVTSLEVSSSSVRERIASGDRCRYLVLPETLRVINEKGLYRPCASGKDDACERASSESSDALSKEFFKERKAELKQRVNAKRFKHIMGVVEACEQLAQAYGVDKRKARLAGLLHDWDKGMDDEQARQRVFDLGMEDEVDPWVVEHMPRVLHGYTAARALGCAFPEIPDDVLQAIDRHTTAAENMSPLDMILYVADAIEPGRQFGRIDELRAVVGKVDLNELYFQTYEYWIFLLFERRKTLHPDTMRIWNANILSREAKDAETGKTRS